MRAGLRAGTGRGASCGTGAAGGACSKTGATTAGATAAGAAAAGLGVACVAPQIAQAPTQASATAANIDQQPVVYVLAEHRMQRTDPVASGSTRPDVAFAGQVSPGEVASARLKKWLATTPYLTATSQWLPDPSQIVTDFTFARAPDDQAFQQVLYDDSYLLPGDVGAALVLLVLVGAVWLVVRLARRRQSPSLVETP